MTKTEFRKLEVGDIVRHKSENSTAFVVTANYGDRATAVRTVDLTNPEEWNVLKFAKA